jgi:hypothetical protein
MNVTFTRYIHNKEYSNLKCKYIYKSCYWNIIIYLEMSGISSLSNEVAARTASASLARARA